MIQGKHLYFRLIQEEDINFLLSLRLNQNLNKYLSPVAEDKDIQISWINEYKLREVMGSEYYFVIIDKQLGKLGLIRLYNINYSDKSFTWGSWVIREENRPRYAALESLILLFELAFNELSLSFASFEVLNNNKHAIDFYNRFGAKYLHRDDVHHYYSLTKSEYFRLKYNRYIEFIIH